MWGRNKEEEDLDSREGKAAFSGMHTSLVPVLREMHPPPWQRDRITKRRLEESKLAC